MSPKEKSALLKKFMQEFFPFAELKKIGIFTKEMKGNYEAQATKICEFLGLKSIYEYGAIDVSCHLTLIAKRPEGEPFVTIITNIYTY